MNSDAAILLGRCRHQYHYAQYLDMGFEEDKYIWVLGVRIFMLLRNNPDVFYNIFDDKPSCKTRLFNVRVMIDYENEDKISLYKEVK